MTHILRRSAAALLAFICASLLSSCLEAYEEEMVIKANLSGTAVVKVTLPNAIAAKYSAVHEAFSRQKIEELFESLDGVTLKKYTLSEARNPEATFEVAFTSLEKLSAAAAANKPAQMLVGEFIVKKDAEGKTVIERQLGNGTPLMELPSDKYAQFKIHFQQPVELSNTDSGFKDTSHNDVRYRWSLGQIASQKPSMVNKLMKPVPWILIISTALVLLILGRILWLSFIKNRVRQPAPPSQAQPQVPQPRTQSPQTQMPAVKPAAPLRPGPPR